MVAFRLKRKLRILLFVIFLLLGTFLVTQTQFLYKPTFWSDFAVTTEGVELIRNTNNKEQIPKIFHHTWKDKDIPEKWKYSYQNCKNLYPDFKFMLWTDESSEGFIKQHYRWFLKEYQSYSHQIQRVDAIRYFLLYHFGGIYSDLDIGCSDTHRIEPLLKFDAFLPKTKPIGFSNDLMGSKPKHKFFDLLIKKLPIWDHWYGVPYATVFFSTGPMFLSLQYGGYSGDDSIYILMPDVYSDGPTKIFKHIQGSTWHSWDANLIKLIWGHKIWACLILLGLFLSLKLFFRIDQSKTSE